MDLIPHDEIRPSQSLNFAPMVDFLFLMLSIFATLAISRATLYDAEVQLVDLRFDFQKNPLQPKQERQQINLSVTSLGNYKWLTEYQEYPMETIQAVQEEIAKQYELGVIPQDKALTEILLHIDKQAPWEPIANLIFAIRELGFTAHPVYEQH